MFKAIALLVLLTLIAPFAGAARADDTPTILVDRRAEAVAIYFNLPATELPRVFGAGAEDLLGADGTVDIPKLYDGTFLLADRILADTEITLGGAPETFEGLSMMVHDPNVLPDFASPYDAELSIAVCTSPETVRDMTLDTLEAYLGYYAWKVDGRAALDVRFPELGREAMTFRVLEFVDFQALPVREVTIVDGGTLSLARITEGQVFAQSARAFVWSATIGAILILGTGLIILALRRPRVGV